ncbi:GNAT family N-acetyltransferase [Burkholderia cepacia]|uniref:GNAT family N-acetyltransferase n=1 Tax=Burkholderia cepacia TaxID=292 RepID=UPI002ABDCDAB|nr:GNAT family N-acetyltransferase [Burkholderia cepacia]
MSQLRIEFSVSLEYPMLTVLPLISESASDCASVLRVFIEAPSYTELVKGRSASTEDVDDFFFGKPVSANAAQKSVFGFFVEQEMIGCADVIRSYPTDDCIWIGLILLTEANQGRGYGKAALKLLIEMVGEWGYRAAQLAVVSTNPRAHAFWQCEGFDEIRRVNSSEFTGDLIVMQRSIG